MVWYKDSEGRHGQNGKKGDQGEEFVWKWFDAVGVPYEVLNDIKSQVEDKIDATVNGVPVDIKSNIFKDYHAVELSLMSGKEGWLYTSLAKAIVAVDLDGSKIYSYRISDMKDHVDKNKARTKETKHGDTLLWVNVDTDFIVRLK
mgnify:CR=1 FL=1|tara:strand:- start:1776 stop:2210 length:435 start_codon:yes stop_codon:yes gene_type:complete